MSQKLSTRTKLGYVLMALPGAALEGLIYMAVRLGLASKPQRERPSGRPQPYQPPS